MKSLFLMVVVAAINVALADISSYTATNYQPRGALLVLPPQNSNETDSHSIEGNQRNLTKLNEDVMEKLRQQIGSDTGVYYVYLPDGRLQQVQYTTAPITQQESQTEQEQSAETYKKASEYRQNSASNTPQSNQQSNHQIVFGTNKQTTQGNQQQFSKYLVAQQQPSIVLPIVELPLPQTGAGSERDQERISSQYNEEKAQNGPASNSYVASIHFTDVPPINGPIFAYNQSPLDRIVRYAN